MIVHLAAMVFLCLVWLLFCHAFDIDSEEVIGKIMVGILWVVGFLAAVGFTLLK